MQTLVEQLVEALEKAKRELDADRECLFCFCQPAEHVDDCPTPLIEAALDRYRTDPEALLREAGQAGREESEKVRDGK